MERITHTPRPCKRKKLTIIKEHDYLDALGKSHSRVIAKVGHACGRGHVKVEEYDNAALIAAAPDLYEALRVIAVEARCRKERGMSGIASIAEDALEKARLVT
jgi:hypothetical protein